MSPAGWCADPWNEQMVRYWDGSIWTQHSQQEGPSSPAIEEQHRRRGLAAGFRTEPAIKMCL